jgi:hypothetical protein
VFVRTPDCPAELPLINKHLSIRKTHVKNMWRLVNFFLNPCLSFKTRPYAINVEFHNVGGCGTYNYHCILNDEISNRANAV